VASHCVRCSRGYHRPVAAEIGCSREQQKWLMKIVYLRPMVNRRGTTLRLNIAFLFAVVGASAQLQKSSKAQDESELRRIESETAKF